MKKQSKKTAPTISIIIGAKNNGKYLRECLESCLNQNHPVKEVIYSDDFSDDDSVEIARSIPGVKVITHTKWHGVVRTRNDGVKASTGEALVHVDGDDVLPPDFIEKHLEVFNESTPFVYCCAQAFGTKNNFWGVPKWNEKNIWLRNWVNTSTMMWRWVFDKAGGWQETKENTMWDWSLAIRASRFGTPQPSTAVLHYRFHPDSSSARKRKCTQDYIDQHLSIRKQLVQVSIGLVYGGRLPELMPLWMDCLINDISILENKPEFIIVNNTHKPLNWLLPEHYQHFSRIKIMDGYDLLPHENRKEHHRAVSTLLADCHNDIENEATGDVMHFREDDMTTCPGAFEELFNFLMDIQADARKAAVGALYLNRHHDSVVGGTLDEIVKKSTSIKNWELDPVRVDFTGTGCLLYWRNLSPQTWFPCVNNVCAHDWRFGVDLKEMGNHMYVLPTARCRHYVEWKWIYKEPHPTQPIHPVETHTRVSAEAPGETTPKPRK